METTTTLEKLRFLTERLPTDVVGSARASMQRCLLTRGTCLLWDIYSTSKISCTRCFISTGTIIPSHRHNSREWLIPYQGALIVNLDKHDKKMLLSGELLIINPDSVHSITCDEDCWFISISVPSALKQPD